VSSQTIQSYIPAPTPAPIEMAPPETGRRGRSRRTARTQFKGFDDDFSGPVNFDSVPESMEVDKSFAAEPESQSLFVSQTSEMAMDREASNPPETQTRATRKRRAPSSIIEEEDIMDQIAPTAAAQKRRRLADEAARRRRGESPPPAPIFQKKKTPPPEPAPKKAKKEIDVLEHARQQREKAEALEKAERETLQEQLQGTEIEKMRDLAIIEEVEVKRRAPRSRAVPADESERWDEKWNGRKNYKKFRRQGAAPGNARDNIKVIVQLEEVKQKDFGIGDDYWDTGDSQRKSKKKDKGKGKETQSQDISQVQVSQGKNTKSRAAARAAQILASEAEEEMDRINDIPSSSDVEIVDPPPKAPEKLKDKTSTSQNVPPTTSNKRAAAMTLAKPAPAKKLKQTVMKRQASEEDSDDDELKFRFKKRV
jgi:nijmegen breakage syndrome protein 1